MIATGLTFTVPFFGCLIAALIIVPALVAAEPDEPVEPWLPRCWACGDEIDDDDDIHDDGEHEYHTDCCPYCLKGLDH